MFACVCVCSVTPVSLSYHAGLGFCEHWPQFVSRQQWPHLQSQTHSEEFLRHKHKELSSFGQRHLVKLQSHYTKWESPGGSDESVKVISQVWSSLEGRAGRSDAFSTGNVCGRQQNKDAQLDCFPLTVCPCVTATISGNLDWSCCHVAFLVVQLSKFSSQVLQDSHYKHSNGNKVDAGQASSSVMMYLNANKSMLREKKSFGRICIHQCRDEMTQLDQLLFSLLVDRLVLTSSLASSSFMLGVNCSSTRWKMDAIHKVYERQTEALSPHPGASVFLVNTSRVQKVISHSPSGLIWGNSNGN